MALALGFGPEPNIVRKRSFCIKRELRTVLSHPSRIRFYEEVISQQEYKRWPKDLASNDRLQDVGPFIRAAATNFPPTKGSASYKRGAKHSQNDFTGKH